MSIVPVSKHDMEACRRLAAASDDQVRARIEDLLAWTQDMNWSVAPLVVARIRVLGPALVAPLREILQGADDVWKCGIVGTLLPVVDRCVVESLREDLDRIVAHPAAGEVREGLPEAVQCLRRNMHG